MAVQEDGAGRGTKRQRKLACLRFGRQKFFERDGLAASCWAMSLLSILGISSRNPKMQLGSSPTMGSPRFTKGVSASTARSGLMPRLTDLADCKKGAATA